METPSTNHVTVPAELVEAIRTFPRERVMEHCGRRIVVSPFDFYASCPDCGTRIKLRAFSALDEIEDVFDAVFSWMQQPGAAELVKRRHESLEMDSDDE
jgi:hypothetical protein